MQSKDFNHVPVLLKEVLQNLNISPNGIYVDATVGGAGHSIEIVKKLTNGKLFAFDKDPDAVLVARKKLQNYPATVFHADFCQIKEFLSKLSVTKVDGVLMDLGVSSFQLDTANRGFSYNKDGPLDMRMSKFGLSAKDILNKYSKQQLIYILKNFGEEKFARQIADKIIKEREKNEIKTTTDFSNIIKSVIPFKFKRNKNPCKKSFQAIRIAVNNELESLKQGLNSAFSLLKPGARLLVISFHSIEDKIVKNFYKDQTIGCICSKKFPICVCNNIPKAKLITKKPILPSCDEISFNKRAHFCKT